MQTRKLQLQRSQLELFHPQPELIDWHKLPRETQQRVKTLLVKLLREHVRTPLPGPSNKAGNYE